MWSLFIRTLKDKKMITFVYILSAVALLWMYVSFFPSFKDQTASIDSLMKSFPESLMKAFNVDVNSFGTIEGFISSEQFSFVWPILMIFMTVSMAASFLAGEIEKGTSEILLSLPQPRWKIFISRYLVGFSILIVFTFLSIYAIIPLANAYDISVKNANISTMALLSFCFSISVYSLSMFFSALFSDKGKVFFLSGAVLVGMYVLNIISALKTNLVDLKYYSFFYYFNPAKALIYNSVDHWAYIVFISFSLLFILLGLLVFTKRDAI